VDGDSWRGEVSSDGDVEADDDEDDEPEEAGDETELLPTLLEVPN